MPKVTLKHEDGREESVNISQEVSKEAAAAIACLPVDALIRGQKLTEEQEKELTELARMFGSTNKGVERG